MGFGTNFGQIYRLFDTNFGKLYYYDKSVDNSERHVEIIPLYALSNLPSLQVVLPRFPQY